MGTAGRRPRWPRVGTVGGAVPQHKKRARVLGGLRGGWLKGNEREGRALFSDTAYLLKKKKKKKLISIPLFFKNMIKPQRQ